MKYRSHLWKLKTCFLLTLLIGITTHSLFAQTGVWIEQALQPTMSGALRADCGEDCLGYTREYSQYVYFFDVNISQWTEIDLGSPQRFRSLEAKGQTVMAYTDEMIIGYSSFTSQWDTVYYKGILMNPIGSSGFGCGEKLAYFVTNEACYVFDSELAQWRSYTYSFPGNYEQASRIWCGDDYVGVIFTDNTSSNYLNIAYSLIQHEFAMTLEGGYNYFPNWVMTHGFVTGKTILPSTYEFGGYSSQTNLFVKKTIVLPSFTGYEAGSCFYPENFVEKNVAVFHYQESQNEAQVFAFDTRQGNWNEISYYYNHEDYSHLSPWLYGGSVAGSEQTNVHTQEYTYLLYDGTSNSFATLTSGIYNTGTPSPPLSGGTYVFAYDTTNVWFYNPANQNSQYVERPWKNTTGNFVGDYFVTTGSFEKQGSPIRMHIYNANTDQITSFTTEISVGVNALGSQNMCAMTAGAGFSDVYFYSGLTDSYKLISFPANSYPGITARKQLGIASTNNLSYLYDASINSVFSVSYLLNPSAIGDHSAIFKKDGNTIDGYSTQFQQLTEFPIPEGIYGYYGNDYIGLVSTYGFTNFYAYNGFYNNLVELMPGGTNEGSMVGNKIALVSRSNIIYAFDPQASPTSMESNQILPSGFYLGQNYPNPFHEDTMIGFSLPYAGIATLKIYNLLGKEVETLYSEYLTAGKHNSNWSAKNLANGFYTYKLEFGNFVLTGKMLLIK